MRTKIAFAAALLFSSCPLLAAQTFSLTGSNVSSSNTYGNVRTFNFADLTVQASAYSWNGSTLETAFLGSYSSGLGVTNRNEGNGSAANSHTIDNLGQTDFVVLALSRPLSLTSAVLTPFAVTNTTRDNDAFVSSTTVASPSPSLTTETLAALMTNGKNVSGVSTGDFSTPLGVNQSGNLWIIGAASSSGKQFDNLADGFKLTSITTAAVPEPQSWFMMFMGFFGLGVVIRRAKKPDGIDAEALPEQLRAIR